MLKVVQTDQVGPASAVQVPSGSLLDEIAREGARRMLAAALEAEVASHIEALAGEVDEDGTAVFVNGHLVERSDEDQQPVEAPAEAAA